MSTSRYIREALIGQGSFGEVWRAVDRETGETVAVKAVDLEAVDEEMEVVQREIHVMCLLDTPYVVRYHRSYIENTTLYIIMEYMQSGSLRDLVDLVGPLPEAACAYVIKNLLGGLAYIHSEGKLHRDIKCANTLLGEGAAVKLADFGVAASVAGTIRKLTTCRGSPLFMAPEVISTDNYGPQADVWSLGITAIECAEGLPPLANLHPFRAIMVIPKSDPPRLRGEYFSKEFKDFIGVCLRKDWRLRPSAQELLEHPFLKRADRTSLMELIEKKQTIEKLKNLSKRRSKSTQSAAKSPPLSPHNQAPPKHHAWDFTLSTDIGLQTQDGKVHDQKSDATERVQTRTGTADDKVKSFISKGEGHVEDSQKPDATVPHKFTQALDGKVHSFIEDEDNEINGNEPNGTGISDAHPGEQVDVIAGGTQPGNVVQSAVLTDLFLPVLSNIRGNLAEKTTENNDTLLRAIGALEVAFVDAEQAHPGISNVLLESLFKEALISPSPDIRAVLMKVLNQGDKT